MLPANPPFAFHTALAQVPIAIKYQACLGLGCIALILWDRRAVAITAREAYLVCERDAVLECERMLAALSAALKHKKVAANLHLHLLFRIDSSQGQ